MGKSQVSRPAVFLDRDGVLNEVIVRDGLPFPPAEPNQLKLYPRVPDDCARLKEAGFFLAVVTNQPDVGRGTQSRQTVEAFHRQLRVMIPSLDEIACCYHAGSRYGQQCDCRKPKTGMLTRLADKYDLDLSHSYLIGDRWRDIHCAHAAGCKAIFLNRGYREELGQAPEFTVKDLTEAVDVLLHDRIASLLLARG